MVAGTVKRAFGCAALRPHPGSPLLAGPIGKGGRRRVGHAFPPYVALGRLGDVGENGVALDRLHTVGIAVDVGAGRNTEITCLRIDRVELSVLVGFDPGDVLAYGFDFPSLESSRRNEHGEIGLAAGAGKCGRDIVFLPLRIGDAENQHVLGQPSLVARHDRGDAQGQAFLAQQRIAAIARTVRPDLARFREVHDPFFRVAGPARGFLAGGQRCAHRMHARNKVAVLPEHVKHRAPHAGHDLHAHNHIGRIREFDADVGDGRTQRPHRERHHVQCAAAHATVEQPIQRAAHFRRCNPIVGRACVVLLLAADEGALLDPRNVGRIRQSQVRIRAQLGIEALHHSRGDHFLAQTLVFFQRTVAPHDALRLGELRHLRDPLLYAPVSDPVGCACSRGAPGHR